MNRYALSIATLAAACSGGGASEFDDLAASMEGVYSLQSYTHNEAACTPGGESALGNDAFAVAFRQSFLGVRIFTLMSCPTVADCQAIPARVEAGELFGTELSFGASEVGPERTLIGEGAGTGFNQDGTCTLGESTLTTFALAGDVLTIEKAITLADDYPVDAEGFCTTDDARAAAAGNPCSELEVLDATFVAPL